jgi:hypothetical protein
MPWSGQPPQAPKGRFETGETASWRGLVPSLLSVLSDQVCPMTPSPRSASPKHARENSNAHSLRSVAALISQPDTFLSCALASSTFGVGCLAAEQVQTASRLRQFTKAFHHFFQMPGTHSAFAFVVVIAFQVFGFYSMLTGGRTLEHSAPIALMFKSNGPAQRLDPLT